MRAIILILFSLSVSFAELIPAARLTTWTPNVSGGVGVVGGIVNRTTIADDVDEDGITDSLEGIDNTGSSDVSTSIQAAIDEASSGEAVVLPAGTFRINTTLNFGANRDGITFRGQGQGVTILDARMGSVAIFVGTASNYDWAFPTSNNTITSGNTKGSTALTIADTSDFTAGQILQIKWQNQYNEAAIEAGGVPVLSNSGFDNQRRQMVRLVSKTSTVLTVTPGLHHEPQSGLTAQVFAAQFQTDNVGIEDLTIDCTTGATTQTGIEFEQAYSCWMLRVRVIKAANYAFFLYDSLNCEIRKCYGDQRATEGTNGGAVLCNTTSNSLVEDNIGYKFFPLIEVNHGSSGNVFAYNFVDDSRVFGSLGDGILIHGPHNSHNLWEGNISPSFKQDGYFGGASEDTIFRNWLHGTVYQVEIEGVPLIFNRFTRNFSAVGNLLGNPDSTFAAISQGNPNIGNGSSTGEATPSAGDFWDSWDQLQGTITTRTDDDTGVMTVVNTGTISNGSTLVSVVWSAGRRSNMTVTAKTSTTITLDGGSGDNLPTVSTSVRLWPGPDELAFQELDLDVALTTVKKHNYHFVTANIPDSIGADTLPDSLFRSSKPSWFGDRPWPPFVPTDSATASYTQIPAGYRFVNGEDPPAEGGSSSINATNASATNLNISN